VLNTVGIARKTHRVPSTAPGLGGPLRTKVATVSSPRPSRRVPLRLIAGFALPLIAFFALLRVLGNATGALAITDAIPLLWVVAYGIWRHRLEPIGLVGLAVFGLALVLTIAFGGSPLPLELRRSWFPGTVGLVCLISLAVRRPLLYEAANQLAAAQPDWAAEGRPGLDSPGSRRSLATLTAIIGVTGIADAVAQIVLALTVSTATFVVVARIASWTIIGTGLAVGAMYASGRAGDDFAPPAIESCDRTASRPRACAAQPARLDVRPLPTRSRIAGPGLSRLPGLTCKSWGSCEGKGSAICSFERATAPARAVKGPLQDPRPSVVTGGGDGGELCCGRDPSRRSPCRRSQRPSAVPEHAGHR
jgi:hypothetical protein